MDALGDLERIRLEGQWQRNMQMDLSEYMCTLCEGIHILYKGPQGDIHCGRGSHKSGGQDALSNGINPPLYPVAPVVVQWAWPCSRDGGYAWVWQHELPLIEVTWLPQLLMPSLPEGEVNVAPLAQHHFPGRTARSLVSGWMYRAPPFQRVQSCLPCLQPSRQHRHQWTHSAPFLFSHHLTNSPTHTLPENSKHTFQLFLWI